MKLRPFLPALALSALLAPPTAARPGLQPPPAPRLVPELAVEGGKLSLTIDIPRDYHLFGGREQLRFDLKAEGATLGEWEFPRPEKEEIGPVYRDRQTFSAPLIPAAGATSVRVHGLFKYQPCLEVGKQICYLQQSAPVDWRGMLSASPTETASATANPLVNPLAAANAAAAQPGGQCPSPAPAGGPENPFSRTPLRALLFGFLGGLALNLTPCTWPLIPITLGVLGALGTDVRRAKSFALSAGFALGLVIVYAALGVFAALAGKPFGAATQNPWIYLVMAGLFILFAVLTVRGAGFELPAVVSWKLDALRGQAVAAREGRAAWAGVLAAVVIGAVSGLIVSPCTGPVLAAALVHVAQTRSALYGFSLFFAIGAGMALPFVFLGLFSARLSRLPRSGEWMEVVKRALGAVIFLAAVYFLNQGLSFWLRAPLMKALALVGAALPMALFLLPWGAFAGRAGWLKGALAAALVAVTAWAHWPRALAAAEAPAWRTDYQAALFEAVRDRRPVIVDFWATWCAACHELDEVTYASPEFAAAVKQAKPVLIKFDMSSDGGPLAAALKACFEITGLPTVVFIGGDGRLHRDLTVTGYEPPGPFAERLARLK